MTILVMLVLGIVSVQAVTVEEMRLLNVPVVVVKTVDGEIPTCDFAEAPEGCDGITSVNQTKVPARMLMVLHGDTLYDSGEYLEDESGLTIRIRGNTSSYYRPMKPYKLKLQKKADLLNREDKRFKDKDWLLLNYYFYTPFIANKILDLLNFGWHPEYKFVNYFLNEDYQGLYILSESIKRDPESRVDVSKSEGFLFENDPYWWSEIVYADASAINNRYKFTFKYPDSEKITQDQIDFISSFMENVENSILDGTYPDRIDVESFVKWLLLHDMIGTYDSGGSNMYLSLYDKQSKVKMVSPWDFDSSFNIDYKDSWSRIHVDKIFYFPYLCTNSNPYFMDQYKLIWNNVKNEIFNEIIRYLIEIKQSDIAADITRSRRYTIEKWYDPEEDDDKYSYYKLDDEIKKLRIWFDERKTWMEDNVNDDYFGIDELTSSPPIQE